jgi:hypothetical protein
MGDCRLVRIVNSEVLDDRRSARSIPPTRPRGAILECANLHPVRNSNHQTAAQDCAAWFRVLKPRLLNRSMASIAPPLSCRSGPPEILSSIRSAGEPGEKQVSR